MAERKDEITMPAYRSAITDALGRPIPDEGPLRVWLDEELTPAGTKRRSRFG